MKFLFLVFSLVDAVWGQSLLDTINWIIPSNGVPYPSSGTVAVGNKLSFVFSSAHNLMELNTLAEFNSCSVQGIAPLSIVSTSILFSAPGTRYFVCGVSGHCNQGQKIAITAIDFGEANGRVLQEFRAQILQTVPIPVLDGQEVILLTTESTTDNVILMKGEAEFRNCNFAGSQPITNSIEVVQLGDTSVPAFRFFVNRSAAPFNDLQFGNTFFISTNNGRECLNGKKLFFTLASPSPTAAPTKPPTVRPTNSPSISPTFSPVTAVETVLDWGNPNQLVRFSENALLTEGEFVTFRISNDDNLVELLSRVDFEACDFSDNSSLVVHNIDGGVSVTLQFELDAERYFASNKVDIATGETHCSLLQERMRFKVTKRSTTNLDLTWVRPSNKKEIEAFAKTKEILKNQVIIFSYPQGTNSSVVQFANRAAFEACDTLPPGALILHTSAVGGVEFFYHDAFIESAVDNTIYFGGNKEDCLAGQKIALKVVEEFTTPTNAPAADNEPNNNNTGVVAGILIGLVVVLAGVIYLLKHRKQNSLEDIALANEDKQKIEVVERYQETPVQGRGPSSSPLGLPAVPEPAHVAVNTSPVSTPSTTASLARNKAVASGLNF